MNDITITIIIATIVLFFMIRFTNGILRGLKANSDHIAVVLTETIPALLKQVNTNLETSCPRDYMQQILQINGTILGVSGDVLKATGAIQALHETILEMAERHDKRLSETKELSTDELTTRQFLLTYRKRM